MAIYRENKPILIFDSSETEFLCEPQIGVEDRRECRAVLNQTLRLTATT